MIGGMAGGTMKQAIFRASTALAVLGMAIPAGAQTGRAPAAARGTIRGMAQA